MARISNEDMDKSLYKPAPKNTNEIQDKDSRGVVAYTILLKEVEEDDPSAYAKTVWANDKTIYYVKQNKYGGLYNPNGMYSEGNASKELRHAGRPNWVFISVGRKVFNYYLKFLETKNEAWLINAEREMV